MNQKQYIFFNLLVLNSPGIAVTDLDTWIDLIYTECLDTKLQFGAYILLYYVTSNEK